MFLSCKYQGINIVTMSLFGWCRIGPQLRSMLPLAVDLLLVISSVVVAVETKNVPSSLCSANIAIYFPLEIVFWEFIFMHLKQCNLLDHVSYYIISWDGFAGITQLRVLNFTCKNIWYSSQLLDCTKQGYSHWWMLWIYQLFIKYQLSYRLLLYILSFDTFPLGYSSTMVDHCCSSSERGCKIGCRGFALCRALLCPKSDAAKMKGLDQKAQAKEPCILSSLDLINVL